MTRRWFHPGVYRESFRQLRIIGITALVILEVSTLLTALGYFVAAMSAEQDTMSLLSGAEIMPAVFAVIFVAAPLMPLYLLRHYNQRANSDFYHALPCRREAVFLSQLAAIFTWITLLLVTATLTATLAFALMGRWFRINLVSVLVLLFNVWATSLLVASGTALAMSVTGTLFTNLAVGAMVLFLPRVFLTFIALVTAALTPSVNGGHLLGIFDPQYNLLTDIFACLLFGQSPSIADFFGGGIYTLVLSLIYSGLAVWGYGRRKSEIAGKSAANRKLQTVFRLALTMTACLIPCAIILLEPSYETDLLACFAILVTYVIALVVYFLYELITMRSFRSLAKSLPALGILLALNLALIFGIEGYSTVLIRQDIAADSVESVSVVRDASLFDIEDGNYFTEMEEEISYKDPELVTMLTEAFNEGNALLREKTEESDPYLPDLLVRFRLKNGAELYRKVLIDETESKQIETALKQSKELHDLYTDLPAVDGRSGFCEIAGLDEAGAREVYGLLRDEVKALPFEDWYGHLRLFDIDGIGTLYNTSLRVSFSDGVRNRRFSLDLTDLTPNATSRYLALYAKAHPDDGDHIRTILNKAAESGRYSYMYLTITPAFCKACDGTTFSTDFNEGDAQQQAALLKVVADMLNRWTDPAVSMQPLYAVTLMADDAKGITHEYTAYMAMPGGKIDKELRNWNEMNMYIDTEDPFEAEVITEF